MQPQDVRYHDGVESIEPDEQQTFDRIVAVMRKGDELKRRQ